MHKIMNELVIGVSITSGITSSY